MDTIGSDMSIFLVCRYDVPNKIFCDVFIVSNIFINIHKYTQLQKKPISHFSGQLWKSELRNENIVIPYSVAFSSASFH